MFSKISIKQRIGLLVISALSTLVLFGAVVTIGECQITAASRDMDYNRILFEQISTTERQFAQLRIHATQFITARDEGAVGEVQRTAAEVRQGLDRLRSLSRADARSPEVDSLLQDLSTLVGLFEKVEAAARQLGLNDTSGLRGQLRTSGDAVEAELAMWPNLEKLMVPMLTMRTMEKNYIIDHSDDVLGPHQKAFGEFRFKISAVGLSPDAIELLQRLIRSYKSDFATFVTTSRDFSANVTAFDQEFVALEPLFRHLLLSAHTGMAQAAERQDRVRERVIWSALVVISILMVAFMAFSLLVARSITQPLARMESGIGEVERTGNLSLRIEIGTNDEVGRTAQAFNALMQDLHNIMAETNGVAGRMAANDLSGRIVGDARGDFARMKAGLNRSLETLSATIRVMMENIRQVADATAQASAAIGMISDGSQGQLTAVRHISVAMDETARAVTDVTESARLSSSHTRKAAELVQVGYHQVDEMVAAVNAIAQSSKEITKITNMIRRLSVQTNMLSLNAAIEAARAGEYGKGFAVVAEEVGRLADRSGKSVMNINQLIDKATAGTKRGVEISRAVKDSIENVASGVTEAERMANAIAAAMEQQQAAVTEIKASVADLTRIGETNAAASDEISATMVQLSRMAHAANEELHKFKT